MALSIVYLVGILAWKSTLERYPFDDAMYWRNLSDVEILEYDDDVFVFEICCFLH